MTEQKVFNLLFCGVGGQGVLKASEVAGLAALLAGHQVRKSEVHGMSQRGGSVESHLRFGPEVHSPLIPAGQADFIVCFDAAEGEKYRHFLKKDGLHFSRFLPLVRQHGIEPRYENTFFLGLLSRCLPLTRETWLRALEQSFPRAQAENRRCFLLGAEMEGGEGKATAAERSARGGASAQRNDAAPG